MTRTLAALAAALIATGARAQTPPAADAPPAAAPAATPAPAAPAAAPAPAASAPEKKKPKGTYAIGSKSQIMINGRAWAEVNNTRADKGKGAAPIHNMTRVSSNSSYLRVRGEREMADGFTAIAQVEAEVGLDGSGGTPFSSTRNTFVGLSSPYGELSIGKFDSPSKETTIGRDPFGGTGIFGYYNTFTLYRADRRMNNAIMYESPSYQGLSAMVAFAQGEAVYTSAGGPRTNPWMVNAAVHYKSGPLFAGVAYEYRNDCANPDKEPVTDASCSTATLGSATRPSGYDQVIRFGADYTNKPTFTKVAVVYDRVMLELAEVKGATPLPEQTKNRDAYWASVTQGLGSNKHQLILNYGLATKYSGKNVGDTSKTGAQTYTAAYRYNFDSDFNVYVAVAQIMNDDAQNYKFGSGSPPANAVGGSWTAPAGSTVTGFGAGVRYNF